ncbi:formyl transferase domain protein, partial [Rhizobium sp. PDO1-076]
KLLASELAQPDGVRALPGTVLDEPLGIACGVGAVRLVRLQKAGGKPLSVEDFLRGTPLPPGTVIA